MISGTPRKGWFRLPGQQRKPRPPREQFAKAWMDTTLTRAEVAEMFGLSRTTVRIIAVEFGLSLLRTRPNSVDPTPEQIRQRCAEIRKTWSKGMKKSRYNKHFAGLLT